MCVKRLLSRILHPSLQIILFGFAATRLGATEFCANSWVLPSSRVASGAYDCQEPAPAPACAVKQICGSMNGSMLHDPVQYQDSTSLYGHIYHQNNAKLAAQSIEVIGLAS